jgi:RNA polymerase sigma-70 factor (ECF subfamily)
MAKKRLHRRMQPTVGAEVTINVVPTEVATAGNFDAMVALHWARVFRFALASLRDRDAAQSLAQVCFLKAHRHLASFRGECSVQTWLMQIAVNLIRDRARSRRLQFWKKTRESGVAVDSLDQWLADDGASAETRLLQREQLDAVWKATAALSEKQRTVFLLRFVEDLDLLEIAAVTGMKEGTVKVHLFRALQAVRQRIARKQ